MNRYTKAFSIDAMIHWGNQMLIFLHINITLIALTAQIQGYLVECLYIFMDEYGGYIFSDLGEIFVIFLIINNSFYTTVMDFTIA